MIDKQYQKVRPQGHNMEMEFFPQLIAFQADGAAFAIATPGNWHVCVSSEQSITELEQAPEDHFSLHAIAKEVGLETLWMPGNLIRKL